MTNFHEWREQGSPKMPKGAVLVGFDEKNNAWGVFQFDGSTWVIQQTRYSRIGAATEAMLQQTSKSP